MRRLLLATLTIAGVIELAGPTAALTTAQDVIQLRNAPPEAAPPQAPAPTTGPLQFEVASIKPNRSGGGQVSIGIQPGGRLTATNVTVRELIRLAYQVQPFQILGGPAWLNSDRFDVQAKAEAEFPPGAPLTPGSGPGVPQRMLQGLLADRFKLVVRPETREMPTYDLVLARRDGSLGDKLKASSIDCASIAAARGRGGAAPPPPPGAGGRGGAGACGMRIGPGLLSGNGVSMVFLANSLSQMVQRIVNDKTGLTGNYEFEVAFTPEGPQPGPGGPPAGAPVAPPVDANAPSIYTAVQEQLGLKLESSRAPVSVLMIDRLEPPTPD
jgi:bla regulator protein BlaR1